MVIAIASGKGGTGKTTIATNLAKAVSDEGVSLLDCDVEEPNSHLFMKPTSTRTFSHTIYVPKVDNELCTGCGKCAELCQFKAIINIKDSVLTFPELCHGCKGCQLICPENAISEGFRENGSISIGHAGNVQTVSGTLRIGEAMAVPLISRVLIEGFKQSASVTLIDAPPGTSCPVIESVKHADFVLLVT